MKRTANCEEKDRRGRPGGLGREGGRKKRVKNRERGSDRKTERNEWRGSEGDGRARDRSEAEKGRKTAEEEKLELKATGERVTV